MSSTDASDLIDSDDASTPQQSRRFVLVGNDESTATQGVPAQGDSSAAPKKRPTKEGDSRGAASTSSPMKKPRLERGCRLPPDASRFRSVTGESWTFAKSEIVLGKGATIDIIKT